MSLYATEWIMLDIIISVKSQYLKPFNCVQIKLSEKAEYLKAFNWV